MDRRDYDPNYGICEGTPRQRIIYYFYKNQDTWYSAHLFSDPNFLLGVFPDIKESVFRELLSQLVKENIFLKGKHDSYKYRAHGDEKRYPDCFPQVAKRGGRSFSCEDDYLDWEAEDRGDEGFAGD